MGQTMRVFVPGLPKTKGSVNARPNGTVYQNVAGSTAWAALMAMEFRRAWAGRSPMTGPLNFAATYVLPVDPTKPGSGDGDKLERNVWDALQPCSAKLKCGSRCRKHSGVMADDVLVTFWTGHRRKTRGPQDPCGIHVLIGPALSTS